VIEFCITSDAFLAFFGLTEYIQFKEQQWHSQWLRCWSQPSEPVFNYFWQPGTDKSHLWQPEGQLAKSCFGALEKSWARQNLCDEGVHDVKVLIMPRP